MDKYLFFATFSPAEEGGYTITYYDVPGCISECDNIEDGLRYAKEALELHLWALEDDGDIIPTPSSPDSIKLVEGEFLVPIVVFMDSVRDELNNKVIKKTLTIPYWINKAALENNINFSKVLVEGLKRELDVNERK
ncbi:type II toxin-antitoxin system HicB family antitoxin [Metaclostridioides mangenotii]|uniref:type II toxin-antitoxin system HicB family antitoxin n=1 Tax=Metaclostridioides mangenotii TaxID=1540 RepID=UPI000483F3B5|nr:type II toxin-antitoxin system HicB family antitoxin [Clostridioides mangenotii]